MSNCNCKPDKISLKIVVIPASMGGEYGTMKPHNGAYYDTVVGYEADGAVFFYDSKGAYILLEPGGYDELLKRVDGLEEAVKNLEEALAEEAKARREHDELLAIKIEDEAEQRKAADNLLNDSITAEAEAREAADNQVRADLEAKIETEAEARQEADEALGEKINDEATNREDADNNLQSQVDALADRSDVVDVVGTHEELESYDTANLGDNDIVKVLNDETHDGAITYYRWNKTESEWSYVGETGPYYTKAETDEKLQSIDHDIENLTDLMPAVKNEYGSSTTDVISQKFVSDKLNGPSVVLGGLAGATNTTYTRYGIAIGYESKAQALVSQSNYSIALGANSEAGNTTSAGASVAIGGFANAINSSSVALGYGTKTTRDREVSIGTTSSTRFLANVTAGVLDTDATNVAQVRDMISEAGGGGTFYEEYGDNSDAGLSQKFLSEKLNGQNILLGANVGGPNATADSSVVFIGEGAGGSWSSRYSSIRDIVIGPGALARANTAGSSNYFSRSVVIGYNAQTYVDDDGGAVAIGPASQAFQRGAVAIGGYALNLKGAKAQGYHSTAIGTSAETGTNNYSVALGSFSKNSRVSEVSVGSGTTDGNYGTRYLANVKAGELDTDATNLAQVKDLISQAGGGAKLYSAYGNNEDGALTQKFVSEKLNGQIIQLGQNSTKYIASGSHDVIIGEGTLSDGRYNGNTYTTASTVIGYGAKVETFRSGEAFGAHAQCSHGNSVALGANSKTTSVDQLFIGGASTRRISGVSRGSADTDAVNIAQLNEAVGNINTLLETLISGEGAKA